MQPGQDIVAFPQPSEAAQQDAAPPFQCFARAVGFDDHVLGLKGQMEIVLANLKVQKDRQCALMLRVVLQNLIQNAARVPEGATTGRLADCFKQDPRISGKPDL